MEKESIRKTSCQNETTTLEKTLERNRGMTEFRLDSDDEAFPRACRFATAIRSMHHKKCPKRVNLEPAYVTDEQLSDMD